MKNQKKTLTRIVFVFALLFVGAGFFVEPIISNSNAVTTAVPTATATTPSSSTSQDAVETTSTNDPLNKKHEAKTDDAGVIGLFGLDWKLFLAQLVNFAIVLFVLWRWVFKPVVSGMEARTKKIEDSLDTADKINKERDEFEQWKAKEMVNARHEATTIIAEAKKTATSTKDSILEQAKQEQQQILEQSKAELEQQKVKTLEEAKSSIADLVILSTEKLLRAKLDGKTDAKLISTVLSETDNQLSNQK